MNKYEDAKKWIDEIWTNSDWSRVDIVWCAVDQLRELIKKETPMKVNKKIIDRREFKDSGAFRTIFLFSCPNCGTLISPPHDEKYCSKCGQRLEYEDE